jgi:hypothetical protein
LASVSGKTKLKKSVSGRMLNFSLTDFLLFFTIAANHDKRDDYQDDDTGYSKPGPSFFTSFW